MQKFIDQQYRQTDKEHRQKKQVERELNRIDKIAHRQTELDIASGIGGRTDAKSISRPIDNTYQKSKQESQKYSITSSIYSQTVPSHIGSDLGKQLSFFDSTEQSSPFGSWEKVEKSSDSQKKVTNTSNSNSQKATKSDTSSMHKNEQVFQAEEDFTVRELKHKSKADIDALFQESGTEKPDKSFGDTAAVKFKKRKIRKTAEK